MQLAHQGELSNSGGPVTGTVSVTFRLFAEAAGGSHLWIETRSVDVVAGHYAILLGSTGAPALSVVLGTNPELWLELEIDAVPLLPRQRLGSAPFALLADTTTNLEGGSVDATSVHIGGVATIDGGGNWVGGAGSLPWDSIGSAPTALLDGDADWLGGLSCLDGEPATWSSSSGSWTCGQASVDLSAIDATSAVLGDVLAFDGLGVVWQSSGDAGGPCTPAPITERFAPTDCGGTPLRIGTEPEFALLGRDSLCAITVGGGLHCAAEAGLPPQGSFMDVDASTLIDGAGCAVRTDGTIACWGPPGDFLDDVPAGTFSRVWVLGGSDPTACAKPTTGSGLTCWGEGDIVGATVPAATFQEVAIGPERACGWTSTGSFLCWQRSGQGCSSPITVPGTYTAVAFTYVERGCGISGGTVSCFSSCSGAPAPTPGTSPTGLVGWLAQAESDVYCGLTTTGAVECSTGGLSVDYSVGYERPGPFLALQSGYQGLCGLRAESREIECWGWRAPVAGPPALLGQ